MRKGELLALRWEDYRDGELWLSRAVCKVTRTSKPAELDRFLAVAKERWPQHYGICSPRPVAT